MKTHPRVSRQTAMRTERPGRKEAILLVAEKLFAHHGYHPASIRQIAAEAEVQPALVDCCYGQKHALFLAIIEHWRATRDERLQLLAPACKGAPRADRLRRAAQAEQVLAEHFDPLGPGLHPGAAVGVPWQQPWRGGLGVSVRTGCASSPHQRQPRRATPARREQGRRPGRCGPSDRLHLRRHLGGADTWA